MDRIGTRDRATSWHWAGFLLAIIAGLSYFVIISPLAPDDFQSPPAPVLAVAAIAYIVGGYLILSDVRWLLIVGLGANTFVLVAFLRSVATDEATIDAFSAPGKLAQLALEVVLLVLIFRR
jgi:hypothetical protein